MGEYFVTSLLTYPHSIDIGMRVILITFTLLMRMRLVQQRKVKLGTTVTNLKVSLDIAQEINFHVLSLCIDIGMRKMVTIFTPQMLMKSEQLLLDKPKNMATNLKASHATFYLHRFLVSYYLCSSLHLLK